jgi:hypothetical protein
VNNHRLLSRLRREAPDSSTLLSAAVVLLYSADFEAVTESRQVTINVGPSWRGTESKEGEDLIEHAYRTHHPGSEMFIYDREGSVRM